MHTALRAVLDKNNIAADIITWMGDNGCTDVSTFANWVDETKELKEAILDQCPQSKDSRTQKARLSMAWREADAATTRGVKRTAEGLEEDNLDDPLPSEIFKAVGTASRTYYNWPDIPAERIGSDRLLGRIRKEFQRKEPSLVPILKVKSLTSSQFEPLEKKTRISPTAMLTVLGTHFGSLGP